MNRRAFLRGGAGAAALALSTRQARAQGTPLSFASSTGSVGLVTQVVRRLDLEKKFDLKLDTIRC